jgi:hypothetical protein
MPAAESVVLSGGSITGSSTQGYVQVLVKAGSSLPSEGLYDVCTTPDGPAWDDRNAQVGEDMQEFVTCVQAAVCLGPFAPFRSQQCHDMCSHFGRHPIGSVECLPLVWRAADAAD